MPLFDFRCTSCAAIQEHFLKDRDQRTAPCTECGEPATKVILSAPMMIGDYASGNDWVTSDITGNPIRITSRSQRDRLCKENGLYIKEGKPKNATLDKRLEQKERIARRK